MAAQQRLIVKKSAQIDARANQVWKAIVDPGQIKQWMFVPPTLFSDMVLKKGTTLQWLTDEGQPYMTGEVIDFVPAKKYTISLFDHKWLEAGNVDRVEYTLELQGENPVTVHQTFGDLTVDPEGAAWFEVYNRADEMERLKRLITS